MPAAPPTQDDLAKLAQLKDAESRDVFVSLYADLSDLRLDDRLSSRAKALRTALPEAQRAAFDASWTAALDLLRDAKQRSPRAIAVFSSVPHKLGSAFALPERLDTRVVVDSGPYVRPLARYLDEHESYLVALVDGRSATLRLAEAGAWEDVGRNKIDFIGRHKKGGMSQARYQRHRQGKIDRHLDEVATQIEKVLRESRTERLILAGPGQAKRELESRLTPYAAERVFAVEDVELDDPEVDARLAARARQDEKEASRAALAEALAALRHDELVVTGAFESARAARDGRVDLLVVRKDHKAGARKCEQHQSYFAVDDACACGSRGTEVDLLNEAVEHAIAADSEVEFVEERDGPLRQAGGVIATLRW